MIKINANFIDYSHYELSYNILKNLFNFLYKFILTYGKLYLHILNLFKMTILLFYLNVFVIINTI